MGLVLSLFGPVALKRLKALRKRLVPDIEIRAAAPAGRKPRSG
jgi:hypothetical protein